MSKFYRKTADGGLIVVSVDANSVEDAGGEYERVPPPPWYARLWQWLDVREGRYTVNKLFTCHRCEQSFDLALASCGTGTTWGLYKCPHCGQMYTSGSVPAPHGNDTIFLGRWSQ